MQTQQIVIEISDENHFSPEILKEARELEREVYFSRLVSKSVLTEFEQREYESFLEEFITEDDEPVDNAFSEKNQKLLTRSLYASWQPLDAESKPRKFFATANVGIFTRLRPAMNPIVPDVLVSLDVTGTKGNVSEKRLRSYMTWEMGKPPEVVVEIVSNQIGDELTDKMQKYARIKIKYYVIFDPERHLIDDVLRVYELNESGYDMRTDYVLPEINLRVVLWEGEFENWNGQWLRWVTSSGDMLLTGEERAAIETKRANNESERADNEAKRANDETKRADESENRAAKLAEKLRELGINPSDV